MALLGSRTRGATDLWQCVFLASIDIEGASNAAPRGNIAATLRRWSILSSLLRFIEAWLKGRRFRLHLVAPAGGRLGAKS